MIEIKPQLLSNSRNIWNQFKKQNELQALKNNLLNGHKNSQLGFLGGNPFKSFPVGGLPVGGWKELGRTTLGSAGDTITVSSLANKRYLMALFDLRAITANAEGRFRLNSDSATNYTVRKSYNGAPDSTVTSSANPDYTEQFATGTDAFNVGYFENYETKEKLSINHSVQGNTAGAGTAPNRMESYIKWDNTSSVINAIQALNVQAGDFNTGSEVVVLGWDPTDVHTDNFWEELGSYEVTGSAETIIDLSFTAKKYLWIQAFIKPTATMNTFMRIGNGTVDTGSNYAHRFSNNGEADGTQVSNNEGLFAVFSNTVDPKYFNTFLINNTTNEKLAITHAMTRGSAGAGNAPTRHESADKWVNTTNQMNVLQLYKNAGTGQFDVGSIIKVWGSN